MRIASVIALGLALAGCATAPVGSVSGGECRIVRTPEYAVKGRTGYDQIWINRTTEALVDGCRQPRPKARPASLDAKPKPKPKPAPQPKKKWWQVAPRVS